MSATTTASPTATPDWLVELEALAEALEKNYPLPAWVDELGSDNTDRPTLTLIRGGRDG